ncbi:MAG: aldo/keto reductase [Candidatus Rokubacteria bacterium]|nr:aldo/keto reductase [Candidatus Rokubacteria bacterium]
MIPGRATAEGTRRYAERLAPGVVPEHFRRVESLGTVSSVGIGTYLGREDEVTDSLYRRAIAGALERGANVVDTAVNYRYQRSERVVGAVLADVIGRNALRRDEVIVATKGGYIPFDTEVPVDPRRYFTDTYLQPGIVQPGDVVAGAHCMTPRYLRDQIARSRANLGLQTIDVYYLHNPEQQLEEVERPEFLTRLRAAFEALEQAVGEGAIGCYGTATWNGYRQPPSAPDGLSLEEVVGAAREVAGSDHHFRVIQLPYNLAMTEAFTRANQRVGNEMVTLLDVARRLGIYVMASASVYQGQLTSNLPAVIAGYLPGFQTDAQRALQFARSTPGIGTALVGMKSIAHVEENLSVAARAPMPWAEFQRLFSAA